MTLRRIVDGAAVVDPALVQQLPAARRHEDPLQEPSPREYEVLALMAEGARTRVAIPIGRSVVRASRRRE